MLHKKQDQQDRYFDHEADIGIIGRGLTVCDAFTDAAKSLFGIVTDISKIASIQCVEFTFEESDIEFALVTYLNLLVNHSRATHIVFNQFQLENKDNRFWYARACGDYWHKHTERGVEVKGSTLTMLSVKKLKNEWQTRCVVDV